MTCKVHIGKREYLNYVFRHSSYATYIYSVLIFESMIESTNACTLVGQMKIAR